MDAFEQIVAQHQGAVYSFLLKLCGFDRPFAEDLMQETFLRAYISIDSFRGACQVGTWLMQIARNCYLESVRKHKPQAISLEELPMELRSSGLLPDEVMEKRELLLNSLVIIRRMDPKMRDVMIYRICGDLPYAQIGALLWLREGFVSSRKNTTSQKAQGGIWL